MNKEKIDKNVKAVFKAHPDAKEIYITSDGFIFLSENAARLHQSTNKSGKKLGFAKVSRLEDASTGSKPLSKMKTAELEAVAKEKGIDLSLAKNNAERVKLIEDFKPKTQE